MNDFEGVSRARTLPELKVCQQARLSRDPRFDGRFYIGVLTTGIYCRTVCPARIPAETNVRYYASAASAQDAGFRPCMRCRPESAQALPEWTVASDTVLRGLRMIEAGFLNHQTTTQLAAELAVSSRHLSRLFAEELGTSPKSIAQYSRARLAVQMLRSSPTTFTNIAHHAGYGSVSRFNSEIKLIYKKTPRQIREGSAVIGDAVVQLKLPIRKPYHFDWIFEYLRARALVGAADHKASQSDLVLESSVADTECSLVEQVLGGPGSWVFRRRLRSGRWVEVHQQEDDLIARLPLTDEPLYQILHRLRRVFDVNADGETIHQFLLKAPALRASVKAAPGLRVPGAWDGFETAVRAVLGQQVSVARGTTLANKMIIHYGGGYFPTPTELVDRQIGELGMPGRRGQAIALMARMVEDGEMQLDECQDYDDLQQQLESIAGIGPWTANYIRMRCSKDPNAFPDNDWVVLKHLQCTPGAARKQALLWQPWRAYALMYIWYASGQAKNGKMATNT